MTEDQKVGDGLEDGAGSQPATPVSDSSSQPINDNFVSKEEFSKAMAEWRGIQSRQDKAENKQQEIIAKYQSLLDSGMKPAEANKAIAEEDLKQKEADRLQRIEDMLLALAGGKVTGTDVNAPTETNRIVEELELDANDPSVAAILAKGLDPEKEELELLRYKAKPKRLASSPPPKTPAPVSSDDVATLAKEYVKKVKELPRGPQSRNALAQIKLDYMQRGVDVHSIDVSS